MSYILDALRRADSERERGAVPGLHTQAVPVGGDPAETEPRSKPWVWIIVAAFIALLGLVAWLWLGRAASQDSAVAARLAAPPVAIAAAPLPVAAVAAPPPVAAAASTAAATALPAVTAAAASAPSARVPAPPARKTATSVAAAPTRKPLESAAPASTPAAAKPTAKAEPAAKASEAEGRIYALTELPEEIRRELPKPAIGGSIYSKSAANRMLVINGQVFHEGDELAQALSLDQIKPKSAILKFKGFRYEVTY